MFYRRANTYFTRLSKVLYSFVNLQFSYKQVIKKCDFFRKNSVLEK